jgi:hypothetical protein
MANTLNSFPNGDRLSANYLETKKLPALLLEGLTARFDDFEITWSSRVGRPGPTVPCAGTAKLFRMRRDLCKFS